MRECLYVVLRILLSLKRIPHLLKGRAELSDFITSQVGHGSTRTVSDRIGMPGQLLNRPRDPRGHDHAQYNNGQSSDSPRSDDLILRGCHEQRDAVDRLANRHNTTDVTINSDGRRDVQHRGRRIFRHLARGSCPVVPAHRLDDVVPPGIVPSLIPPSIRIKHDMPSPTRDVDAHVQSLLREFIHLGRKHPSLRDSNYRPKRAHINRLVGINLIKGRRQHCRRVDHGLLHGR